MTSMRSTALIETVSSREASGPKPRTRRGRAAQRSRTAFAAGLIACTVWGLVLPGAVVSAEESLHVLLLNDDGIEAEGLRAMKRALVEAGHRVIIYAPEMNWSGSSAALTLPKVAVVERRPGEYAIAGSPATAALVAAAAWEGQLPHVAISGINHGSNAGALALFSGTVGGALAAAGPFGLGVPAMAVSADLLEEETGSAENGTHLDRVARFATRLVEGLARSAGSSRLLPSGLALNVNYPAVSSPRGVALCVQGHRSLYRLGYNREESGEYAVEFARIGGAADLLARTDVEHSDAAALARGFVTIAPIRADYTSRDVLPGDWRNRLEAARAAAENGE